MSSLVRKSSHFAPKVKKRPILKQLVSSATPPATQAAETPEPKGDAQTIHEGDPTTVIASTLSPPNTQATKPSENDKAPAEEDIDPIKKIANAIENDSGAEDYGDNDIFKQKNFNIVKQKRRFLVASHRRLSGLGNFRRGSVTAVAGPTDTAEQEVAAPVTIAIPVTKPPKKRRQSAYTRAAKIQRPSVIAPPEDLGQEKQREENGPVVPAEKAKAPEPSVKIDYTTDIVVGICPKTNKLRKFRTSEEVQGHKDLPVAPPDILTTVTDIRQIPKSIDVGDEELFSRIHILTDELSLAELCKPTVPIGDRTENFNKARRALVKIAARRDERRVARMLAREKKISYEKALLIAQGYNSLNDGPKNFDYSTPPIPEEKTSVALQIVGGKLQIDQESTVFTRNPAANNENRQIEIVNSFENPITSSSYTKVTYTEAWRQDEVIQLYKALSTWGTNFTFISQLFPHRTRRQVKRKFAAEEKKNPQLVELALKRKLPLSIEDYKQALPTGEKLKTMDDYHKAMEEVRNDHQTLIEEIQVGREKAMKEDLERKENMARGARGLTKREITQNLKKNEVVIGTVDDFKHPRDIHT
ncbi:transcription factor IIIB, Bdp1 subunit [Metschnikowia bicuspidata]|uniref:Transcription factor IIIB, Bdp1 subunit n=1 Tax=Metschnikowia bicuspidata TaxID=27322 RepID=A0A4P9ZIP5_9ASCO|nr:transcription factor IIIB, Bdp1 subunit [Metschnikowia bicuspidata]